MEWKPRRWGGRHGGRSPRVAKRGPRGGHHRHLEALLITRVIDARFQSKIVHANLRDTMQPFTFFVSYRRQDTAPIALLLKNEIEKRLQFVRMSVDVEEMTLGDHFPDRLKGLIDEAHATIVLIGKHWMPKRGTSPAGRVGDDWVTRELEYSESAPLSHPEGDRFGLTHRFVLPLFADCEPGFDQFELPHSITYL